MSTAEKDLRANLLESAGGGRCTMLETASTVMQRRIGRSAIRNRRDRGARDPRGQDLRSQDLRSQDQRGITLQTLIITSVLVVLAIAVSFTLFAINAGSSEDLEEAGKSDAGGVSCAPNEIFDTDYKSQGMGGPQDQRGAVSSQIGCRQHCATWEFMTAGPNDDGEYELSKDWLRITQDNVGGPTGNEGVFSSRTGCFAPCYWEYTGTQNTPYARDVKTTNSSLHYIANNKAPAINEVRLGVVYRRSNLIDSSWTRTDSGPASLSTDGKRIIATYAHVSYGARSFAASDLSSAQLGNVPTVVRPNWRTLGERGGRWPWSWEDEDWEIRANPESETCEIVNTARNDELVCTSARDNCAPA